APALQRRPVRVEHPSVDVQHGDVLRDDVEQQAQLPFVLPDLLLGLLPIVDVRPGSVPADDASLVVLQWIHADEKPAIGAILPQDTGLHLERRALRERLLSRVPQSLQIVGWWTMRLASSASGGTSASASPWYSRIARLAYSLVMFAPITKICWGTTSSSLRSSRSCCWIFSCASRRSWMSNMTPCHRTTAPVASSCGWPRVR